VLDTNESDKKDNNNLFNDEKQFESDSIDEAEKDNIVKKIENYKTKPKFYKKKVRSMEFIPKIVHENKNTFVLPPIISKQKEENMKAAMAFHKRKDYSILDHGINMPNELREVEKLQKYPMIRKLGSKLSNINFDDQHRKSMVLDKVYTYDKDENYGHREGNLNAVRLFNILILNLIVINYNYIRLRD